ncbi:hypothetical protein [Paraburkholderia acidisoli]|uniref:Uncharacterized protein n=1 Tax=Paraburkholderia acidisoli TaxID=2571748 RepID=A0A7Z2GSC9_9BURK|nr:hypothetical protein [Paraburkholderia acidisoli]QGZ66960.1 hypothetical protein FAZ98_34560 [Paraburkholderia acidisoli]
MTFIYDSKRVPNRVTAKSVHADLRNRGASHFEIGCFYRAMLARRFWPTQSSMSDFFEVSNSMVSRAISLTRIPSAVVDALGGPEPITFRVGDLLLEALGQHGEQEISRRARQASSLGCMSASDILDLVITNRRPNRKISNVQIRLSRDKKTFRLEIAEFERFLPHLGQLEEFLSNMLLWFETTLESGAVESPVVAKGDLAREIDATLADHPKVRV